VESARDCSSEQQLGNSKTQLTYECTEQLILVQEQKILQSLTEMSRTLKQEVCLFVRKGGAMVKPKMTELWRSKIVTNSTESIVSGKCTAKT
jgi:hypothetical protein